MSATPTDSHGAPVIDRARWARFSPKGGRCLVCGHTATISVTLGATHIDGTVGGERLAQEKIMFCDEHGQDRYAQALMRLHGGTVKA
jgi:hypothetical protein